jgi:hypothetical protein
MKAVGVFAFFFVRRFNPINPIQSIQSLHNNPYDTTEFNYNSHIARALFYSCAGFSCRD